MSRLKLKQIQEILITSEQNGDYLYYDSASGLWKNTAAPLDGADGRKRR